MNGGRVTTTSTIEHDPEVQPRKIAHSTRGHNGGMITRLMSPGDVGEMLKPFVFLDLFDTGDQVIRGRNMHRVWLSWSDDPDEVCPGQRHSPALIAA